MSYLSIDKQNQQQKSILTDQISLQSIEPHKKLSHKQHAFKSNQKIQKPQLNHCQDDPSNRQQRNSSINSQFQRYQIKQQNRIIKKGQSQINFNKSVNNQSNNQNNDKENTNQNTIQSYKDWKVYKNKSNLNMLPFPYTFDQSFQYKKSISSPFTLFYPNQRLKQVPQNIQKTKITAPLYKLKIANKVQSYKQNLKQNKIRKKYINYQKTPINQYLSYDLSQQINQGLRDVQMMAQQIRRIKKSKQIASLNQQLSKTKQNKGIRIRKSYIKNHVGLTKSQSNLIRI